MKRKILKILLVLAVFFLLVSIPTYFIANHGANKRLEGMKQAMIDQGLLANLRELVERESNLPPLGAVLERMTSLTLTLPPGLVNANSFARADSYRDIIDNPSSMTAQQQADLIFIFDNNPEFWEMWKEIAEAAPHVLYNVDFNAPAWKWPVVRLNGLFNNQSLAFAVSIALARSGRGADAVAAWRLPVDGTRGLLNDADILLGNLVGIRGMENATDVSQFLVAYGGLDAAMLRTLSHALDGTAVTDGFRRSMMRQHVVRFYHLEDILDKETNPFASYDSPDLIDSRTWMSNNKQRTTTRRVAQRFLLLLGKPFLTKELADIHERSMQFQSVLAMETWEWPQGAEGLGLELRPQDLPEWKVMTRYEAGHNGGLVELVLKTEAQIQTTRLGLACEMWRLDNGELPPSLEVLAPKYIDAVAPDPFTGQPFEYTRSGNAFGIWSKMEATSRKGKPQRVGWGQ